MILDSETASFIEVAKREAPFALLKQTGLQAIGGDVPLRPEVEQWLRGRVEFIRAGLEACPSWFAKTLKRFDPDLRIRKDFYKDEWVIERLSQTDNLYHRCGVWSKALGHELIDALRKGDQWRENKTTEERVAETEAAAAKQREQNEEATREGWLAQVDSLTRKQQEDFVEVSRAIEHGEDLQFMGKDADFMNKVWEEKKNRPNVNEQALNPGVKPGAYRRRNREN